jgi:hypothetical protein
MVVSGASEDAVTAVAWVDGSDGPSGPGWTVATDPESGHQYESSAETGETRWVEVAAPAAAKSHKSNANAATATPTSASAGRGGVATISNSTSSTSSTSSSGGGAAAAAASPSPSDGAANTNDDGAEKKVATSSDAPASKRKSKLLGERVVLRCVCNAVSTSAVGKYLWSVPLRSEPIAVPDSIMEAEQRYRDEKAAATGGAAEDETDDDHSPLRRFEAECLGWLQTPVLAASGDTVLVRMHDTVRAVTGAVATATTTTTTTTTHNNNNNNNSNKPSSGDTAAGDGNSSSSFHELPQEVHQTVVEIDPDVRPVLSDDGRRAAARTDASVVIWDVRAGGRIWSWHNAEAAAELTEVDDEITALTGGVKAWEGGVVAAHARTRPVVPDPGALQGFPFWKKRDKGEKPLQLVEIALRLYELRVRQRRLWPRPPAISGDGRVVAFRDQTRLYIVNAAEPWQATKLDDGSGDNTVRG